jgi:hypothetical protein
MGAGNARFRCAVQGFRVNWVNWVVSDLCSGACRVLRIEGVGRVKE